MYVKDLGRFEGCDPKNTIIIDNLIQSFALNLDTGLPIKPFFDDYRDMELIQYMTMLEEAAESRSLAEFLSTRFRIPRFFEHLK